jgi:arylamine N-acetyltransferase
LKSKQKLFDKYLELLEVEFSSPTFNSLRKIVKAHLIRVPFENISKLLYKKRGMINIPDLSTFLDGIEKYNFGGTCYSNNYYLYLLLEHLGYKIILCGADMKKPDVHLISIVIFDAEEYIVDCGYAAPFFEPLPGNLNIDFVIDFGEEKYIVKPKDESGKTKVEQYNDGKLQHWYTANPQPRKISEFSKVIEDSYADDATFMNAVRITKYFENGSIVIKNFSLNETINNKTSTTETSLNNLPSSIQEKLGMPREIVKEAIESLKELRDIYE